MRVFLCFLVFLTFLSRVYSQQISESGPDPIVRECQMPVVKAPLQAFTGYPDIVQLKNGHFIFVNKSNRNPLNNLQWDEACAFKNGFAKVFSNHKWNLVNSSALPISNEYFSSIRNFTNGFAAAKRNDKWGFINEKGEVVISFQYEAVFDFKEEATAAFASGIWIIIDKTGKIITESNVKEFWGLKDVLSGDKEKHLQPQQSLPGNNTLNKLSMLRNNFQTNGCPANVDFETGNFTNWSCFTGSVTDIGVQNVITVTPSSPILNRHTMLANTIPAPLDPYGFFSTNPPDGSNHAVRLGNDINGSQAERISYIINVPANATDFSINYQYAVVFEDPGHLPSQQPRFTAKLFDPQTNTYLACGTFEFISTSALPGFQNSPVDSTVKIKPWASAFINLSRYPGRTLYLEFTTADCTLGAHWGYAYIDVGNCNKAASATYHCTAPYLTSLAGPPGFQTYNWWNKDYSILLGNGQNLQVPGLQLSSSIWVELIPYNGYGCRDSLKVNVSSSYPIADAGPDKYKCKREALNIGSSPIAGYSYSWSPTSYLSNPLISAPSCSVIFNTAYALTITDNVTGCSAIDTMQVTVNPEPVARFKVSSLNQCLNNNSFSFRDSSSAVTGTISYNWDFGDGNHSNLVNPLHAYGQAGIYIIKLVVSSNNGCEDSITHPVTVFPLPLPAFGINSPTQCLINNFFIFNNQSTIPFGSLSSQWYFGEGGFSAQTTPTYNYTQPGTYLVKLIVSSVNGCKDSISRKVIINPNPLIITNKDFILCRGNSSQLQTNAAQTYNWSPIQGLSCSNCPNPVATPLNTTSYIVTGTNNFGCQSQDTVVIKVIQSLHIEVSPNDSICIGKSAKMMASGANSYEWSPLQYLNNANIPNPVVVTPSSTVKYRVVGFDGFNCFTDTAFVIVAVGEYPIIRLGPDQVLSTGTIFPLTSSIQNGPIHEWAWTPSSDLSCSDCALPSAIIKNDISYVVEVTNIYGCQAWDTINIKAFCKNTQVFIPNAFTPDGDGLNDVLMIRSQGIVSVKTFRIFNRWGVLVFEKNNFPPNDPAFGWDGKIRGKVGAPEVYVYTAEVLCENGVSFTYKGNTTIIK